MLVIHSRNYLWNALINDNVIFFFFVGGGGAYDAFLTRANISRLGLIFRGSGVCQAVYRKGPVGLDHI